MVSRWKGIEWYWESCRILRTLPPLWTVDARRKSPPTAEPQARDDAVSMTPEPAELHATLPTVHSGVAPYRRQTAQIMTTLPLPLILLVLVGVAGLAINVNGSSSATTVFAVRSATSTFVTPLFPMNAGRPSKSSAHPSRQVRQGEVVPISLCVQKKSGGGGGGGGDAVSKKGKVQVQLLETIPNIGQSGDVILVSGAVFQNQLKRGNKARLITNEEVERIEQKKMEEDQKMIEMAMQTKALLEEAMIENLGGEDQCRVSSNSEDDVCGVALKMNRKAGPEGNLFGGVTPKMVLDALKERYPKGSWEGRHVKLMDVIDSNGDEVKAKDIKHVGDYTMKISLWKGIEVTFILSVSSE